MNKSELIDAVAASADLPKAAAGRAIDAMLDTITDSLKKMTLSFCRLWYVCNERSGSTDWSNPQTGAPIEIKPLRFPVSRRAKLKDSVNS